MGQLNKTAQSTKDCKPKTQLSTEDTTFDCISRQAAIDEVRNYYDPEDTSVTSIEDRIKRLPSAQPYTEEEIQAMQDLEQAQLDKAYQIGVEEGLRSAQPQWIPCSERLPSARQSVILSTKEWTGEGCYWETTEHHVIWKGYRWSATYWDDEVIAWMPLPEAYKGEQP